MAPFDSENYVAPAITPSHPPRVESEVVRTLRAAKEKISKAECWLKVDFGNHERGQHCTLGAVIDVSCYQFGGGTHDRAIALLDACTPAGHPSAMLFNDAEATTHADVMSLFDRAISLAQEG